MRMWASNVRTEMTTRLVDSVGNVDIFLLSTNYVTTWVLCAMLDVQELIPLSIEILGPVFSSVTSPVCQEGQSKRTFPIFAFSSQFFPFFPNFPDFFPIFGNFFLFLMSGWHSAPCPSPPVAMPLLLLYLQMLMQ